VHGENTRAILETTLRRGWTIPLELAVMIISGAAAGLHHAHERRGKQGQPLNIVHRDVSPANIMVGYDGSVKVLDFGIAKAEERATKTVGGTIKGKYGYMSPEQCKGKPIDRRSDIFALGIVLYELTTLRRAFKGTDDFETMKRIVAGDVVPPSAAVSGYPRELEAVVMKAMASDVGARFQTGQELIEALDRFAVGAKLTGSNTAMGRFMTQLFGTRKEPWVDGGSAVAGEKTEITGGDPDNEKTKVVEPRPAGIAAVAAQISAAATDAAAWQGVDPTGEKRQSARGISPSRPPPRIDRADHDSMLPQRPTPNPAVVAAGSAPPMPSPGTLPASQILGEEISEVGATPLVDDPKLGWDTSVGQKRPDAGGTRLSSDLPTRARGEPGKGWLILAVVLLVSVAGAVAAIMFATS
jgi:serine/threonine protein kinase